MDAIKPLLKATTLLLPYYFLTTHAHAHVRNLEYRTDGATDVATDVAPGSATKVPRAHTLLTIESFPVASRL